MEGYCLFKNSIYVLLIETLDLNHETWEFLQLRTIWNLTKCSSLTDWIRIASCHYIELFLRIRMCWLKLIMKYWCKVFPFLNVYQNFVLFQKGSECSMCVSLQECNKLIKTPAKSILLTEKKAGISFFGYLFCSFLRLKAENSQPKVPAQRLAEHISWNNFDKVMTWSYAL